MAYHTDSCVDGHRISPFSSKHVLLQVADYYRYYHYYYYYYYYYYV
jgi:hypothetical protein